MRKEWLIATVFTLASTAALAEDEVTADGNEAPPGLNEQASNYPGFQDNDSDGNGSLSQDELNDWEQQAFEEADTDGDGSLSEEEYGRAVGTTGDEVARSLPSEETIGTADEGTATPVPARTAGGMEAESMEE